jgi:hypothetical protein
MQEPTYHEARNPIEYITDDNNCWLCVSHKKRSRFGYVQLKRNGYVELHRYSYSINKGIIPSGMVVRHTCDIPGCFNPDHLIMGTHRDNVADRVARGRTTMGVDHFRAKLTEDNVIEIRSSSKTVSELAREYKVDYKTIQQVVQFVTWKHVSS